VTALFYTPLSHKYSLCPKIVDVLDLDIKIKKEWKCTIHKKIKRRKIKMYWKNKNMY